MYFYKVLDTGQIKNSEELKQMYPNTSFSFPLDPDGCTYFGLEYLEGYSFPVQQPSEEQLKQEFNNSIYNKIKDLEALQQRSLREVVVALIDGTPVDPFVAGKVKTINEEIASLRLQIKP